MPSCTIHIAIAKRYIEKHKNEIKNEQEFTNGVIAPDLNEEMNGPAIDKNKTHYGIWGNYQETITNIDEFLNDEKVDLSRDYWKGYFLHLIADHYFYNKEKFFKKEFEKAKENNEKFYNDFNYLNKGLMEKYKIEPLENIIKYMTIYEGETKYLKLGKIINYVEELSNINMQEKVEIIKQKGMEGLE